ncbi:MAG TPA: hypothetical protein VNT75_20985 [Symbiobacteriaceae bacterium]|nr:hypothetical protein [Symbiobacteriaceae bacterium]
MNSLWSIGTALAADTLVFMALAAAALAHYHRVRQPITANNARNVTRRLGSITRTKVEQLRGGRTIYLAQVQFADRHYRRWVAVGSRELYDTLPVDTDLEMDMGQHFEFTEVIIAFKRP